MLSLTVKYALKGLSELTKHDSFEFLQVEEVAKKANIPIPYFRKIVRALTKRGIIESKRGAQGGIRLPPKTKISFYDVCQALDDPLIKTGCFLSDGKCNSNAPCLMHKHWTDLKTKMVKTLKETIL